MGKEDGGLHVAGPHAHVECIQDFDWEGAKIVSREMDLKEKDKLVKDLNHYMNNIINLKFAMRNLNNHKQLEMWEPILNDQNLN